MVHKPRFGTIEYQKSIIREEFVTDKEVNKALERIVKQIPSNNTGGRSDDYSNKARDKVR